MRTDQPQTIHLKDYAPYPYNVGHCKLDFKIYDDKTIVKNRLELKRHSEDSQEIRLDGEHQKLLSVKVNGKTLGKGDYKLTDTGLIIDDQGVAVTLEIESEIDPASNTALEGLYKSGGNYCTQCEAEGFRRITYFPDRPDVMTTFTVRVEANKDEYPVLLSNGNLVEEGDLDKGRHFTVWDDPFPKPCYLFALVAGDLVHLQDEFVTQSGRKVDLRIYVREGDETQCDHAMESLKKSMKWDEDVYGREYELDRFNIVAVSDFNMGAMENTSLNIFNTALVLAHPDTATDLNFMRVEGVIAHEYFHNWTGNRVTCRDWFQLSLKEGLTVFRDQEFSSDLNSRAVQRIDDVIQLRRSQFPEDASPMAHPIRPDNYIEINNFYTPTVYEKGAEVIRMQHTLLGAENYRKATDLYFQRYDGMAVTCEDFVECMADASGRDMSQFFRWYLQAGTPVLKTETKYNEDTKTFTVTFKQELPDTPGQKDKKPFLIPVNIGLLNNKGQDMDLGNGETSRVLEVTEMEQSFTFENIGERPAPSVLRNFSAPVKLQTDLTDDDLRFLQVHDSDGFNRWEAGQTLAMRQINAMLADPTAKIPQEFTDSYAALLDQAGDPATDKALLARSLSLPDFTMIANDQNEVDPQAIHKVREKIKSHLAKTFESKFLKIFGDNKSTGQYSPSPKDMGMRALKNTALAYLITANESKTVQLAKAQFDAATNMTDRAAALSVLADTGSKEREDALRDFYVDFKDYQLVIDKWFTLQAMADRPQIFDDLKSLRAHGDFNIKNPNRVRSLYAAFAMNNPVHFHDPSGKGYGFLRDAIIELNDINPQIAARLLTPLREWKRYKPDLQKKMKTALEDIVKTKDLSPNVYEIATKSLKL
ncbi:MAG: aminopeptidase N [Micavibrio sp.]|nr:aminopeptidase N [Micavibrio sp.]